MSTNRLAITLPYAVDALEPIISAETIEYHFGKHYHAYLNNYNSLIAEQPQFSDSTIEEIIQKSSGGLYNNAAQMVNHEMYFLQFTGNQDGITEPTGVLMDAVNLKFGSFEELRKLMTEHATKLFGSGWVWLALDDKNLVILEGSNAYTPLSEGMQPLLAIDVWEHAYYIDFRNNRAEHLDKIWNIIDWSVIGHRYVNAIEGR